MKKHPAIVSALVLTLAAAVLFAMNMGFKNVRREIAGREHIHLMQTLLPGSEHFEPELFDDQDSVIKSVHRAENGYVIETICAGYADEIRMIIGVNMEGRVTGLVVRDMHETRSLGAKALTDTDFLAQFLNTSGEAEIGVNVDALSGATVTSRAIATSVNAAVAYVTGADISSSATP